MTLARPNPDQLLRHVVDEEARANKGKLTLFFGAAPGVGKTYAMLEVARAEREQEKRDVVVGLCETHGRYETGALLLGLELLPRRRIEYRGVALEEFDLDRALQRRPQLVLIDELAHSNAEGSRHPKRWQDVVELLDAGIDVFSSLNVQHVESLNDLIAKITGVVVRETVPDSLLERAHAIKLIDLPPDDLLERLREGKVYVPAQAERAIENFFKKGNLIALRELALRYTAEHVDAQMRAYRAAHGLEQSFEIAEQILVAVSPSPYSARLIRAARRMAGALHARWFAVYVEIPSARKLPKLAQATLSRNLRLASELGAEVVTLSDAKPSEALLGFAREHKITKIILGKPVIRNWGDRLRGSLVDAVVRQSRDIDVYVTAGDTEREEPLPKRSAPRERRLSNYLGAALVCLLATAAAWTAFGRDQLADVVMIYLLGIVLVSARLGLGPSILAALLSVAAFDFVFVPPYLTFAVADFSHTVTFLVMFVVAIVISGLTQRIRNQARAARDGERRTRAIYRLSRELSAAQGSELVLEIATRHLEAVFHSHVIAFTHSKSGKLEPVHVGSGKSEPLERQSSIAEWVWRNQKEAGLGTATLPGADALYVPLLASGGIVAVLSLRPIRTVEVAFAEQRPELDAFAAQIAMALERAKLAELAEQARLEIEREQLRSSLLSSVSHDLRTPLAVITGAASTLSDSNTAIDELVRKDLTDTIQEEAERLNRLIGNLLDMTRLESGAVQIKKEWLPLEELVGSALHRLEPRLVGRELELGLPRDLPLVPCDAILIEQALINLIENAIKYGKDPLEINATRSPAEVVVEVADRGPGVPEAEQLLVFDKFHRAVRESSSSGVGLGLTICRAIVAAHGGRIWVENRHGGGASFRFALPLAGKPPELPAPDAVEQSSTLGSVP